MAPGVQNEEKEDKEKKEKEEEKEKKAVGSPDSISPKAAPKVVKMDERAKRGQNRLLGGLLTGETKLWKNTNRLKMHFLDL